MNFPGTGGGDGDGRSGVFSGLMKDNGPKPTFPFNPLKFPEEDDEDLLLTEQDLARKGIVYCRKEILHQMRCAQWARDEYLKLNLDPADKKQWYHYHLKKCFHPFWDARECVVEAEHRELQEHRNKMSDKQWDDYKQKFIKKQLEDHKNGNNQQMDPRLQVGEGSGGGAGRSKSVMSESEAGKLFDMFTNLPLVQRRARKMQEPIYTANYDENTQDPQRKLYERPQRQPYDGDDNSADDVQIYPYTKEQSYRQPKDMFEAAGMFDKPEYERSDNEYHVENLLRKKYEKQKQQQQEAENKKKNQSWYSSWFGSK